MIPHLIEIPSAAWDVLPPGIHVATLAEVQATYATNPRRKVLFDGFVTALKSLKLAGCLTVYLDGSFVSAKPHPGDFDACWDPSNVNPSVLDPVFLDFSEGRRAQKARFGGEFFISTSICGDSGTAFLQFFQVEKLSGSQKGIIQIFIANDPLLL
jgi:hypothetical protein